ncbi:MAG: UDP-3-O-acyl-N-acetylglucosamine deacetylase [Halobacteriovoraceae bacterium]|nr:UDP-3-O-acyl-N-acetylglucosamine deacetylase [Halobacteriovoraceae bacterium]
MLLQRTITKQVQVTGLGLHTGRKITLKLSPMGTDSGVCFRRSDIKNSPILKADARSVGATENNTTLGEGVGAIHTVEHLLSVLYGLGIDNILCEVDGPEIPIMDGSGASFVFLLKEVGVEPLNKVKTFLVVTEEVEVHKDGKWAKISPASSLVVDSTIIFPHSMIKKQQRTFKFSCESFIDEVSRARTFGMLKDVDMLKRKGLIKGGSLDNAIVLDDYKVLNPEGLRFVDEFIRHKILDLIGDFSLLGHEIAGKITTYKSGHNIHNLLCRKLLDTPTAYKIVSASDLEMREEAVSAFVLPSELAPSFSN